MIRDLFCRKELSIFVGYGKQNSTTVLDFFAPGMYDTSYLQGMYDTCYFKMQHLCAGHIVFRSDSSFCEISAILYPRSITTIILE